MSTVTGVVAYVIKNVFSRVRNTDSDMSSQSAAGKLLHMVGPLTAKFTVVSRCAWNYGIITILVFNQAIQTNSAWPYLWQMSTGDGYGYRWRRDDKFWVTVGCYQDCWHTDIVA